MSFTCKPQRDETAARRDLDSEAAVAYVERQLQHEDCRQTYGVPAARHARAYPPLAAPLAHTDNRPATETATPSVADAADDYTAAPPCAAALPCAASMGVPPGVDIFDDYAVARPPQRQLLPGVRYDLSVAHAPTYKELCDTLPAEMGETATRELFDSIGHVSRGTKEAARQLFLRRVQMALEQNMHQEQHVVVYSGSYPNELSAPCLFNERRKSRRPVTWEEAASEYTRVWCPLWKHGVYEDPGDYNTAVFRNLMSGHVIYPINARHATRPHVHATVWRRDPQTARCVVVFNSTFFEAEDTCRVYVPGVYRMLAVGCDMTEPAVVESLKNVAVALTWPNSAGVSAVLLFVDRVYNACGVEVTSLGGETRTVKLVVTSDAMCTRAAQAQRGIAYPGGAPPTRYNRT